MPREWCMRRSSLVVAALVLLSAIAWAQVLSPLELKDPDLRPLQQQYMDDLKQVGQDILALKFDYPFYLSRKLDLDQAAQERAEQRSIRFDKYNGLTVLAVTGNYYAAYSSDKMNPDQRARATFLNVVMPLLKAEVPRFQTNRAIKGYAVEVSHHLLGRVMGVSMEHPENLMVFLPQAAAIRLIGAKDDSTQQAALLQGQAFLNAQPVTIWINGEGPQLAANTAPSADSADPQSGASAEIIQRDNASAEPSAPARPSIPKPAAPPAPARDTSPAAIAKVQADNKDLVARMTKELDPQAHFVNYAAQGFVPFRQGIYLEFSLNTALPESAAGSRYKLAAMAFDDHISHIIRPALAYFKQDPDFDGISFSTSVHVAGKSAAASTSQAVEFFFPFSAMRCYERYDCTGQQLIDAGTVLVNGERVGLDLQAAEASAK